MEIDKLNNGENPSASSSVVQENDEFSFTNWSNDASDSTGIFLNGSSARVDPLSFPIMPSPSPAFPWKLMHGTYPPYTHTVPDTSGSLMIDLNQLCSPQNPPVDLNSTNMRTGIPNPYRQNLPFSEGNIEQVSYTHDKSGVADASVIDSTFSNRFKISEINRNSSLIRGNAGRGYEMTGLGVDSSYIRGPPLTNFVGLGGSETINSQNIGVLNIDNRDHASQFGCPKNTDCSFLSLGIGDQRDARFKSDLSRGEIPGELVGAVFPQLNASHVQQATGSSLNPRQNLFSAFPVFQNNVGGFTGLRNDAGGLASTNNNGGVIRGTNTTLISRPSHLSQKPQADIQHGFSIATNRNLGFVDDRDSRYVNSDPYKAFVGGVTTPSVPISSSSARLSHSGQVGASAFTTESLNFTGATTEPTSDELQRRFMETVQTFLPNSSMVSSFGGVKGSSIRQEHSGQLFPPTGCNPTVAAGDGFFPKRAGFQVNKASTAQAAGSGLFPKRLGIQVNENSATQAVGDGLFPKGLQEPIPLQTKDLLGPTSTAGPVISTAKGYGLSQASNALGGPHRRGTIRSPPASPQVQRKKIALQPPILPTFPSPAQHKKIALQPPILPSLTYPPQTAPAATIRPPPASRQVQCRKIAVRPPILPTLPSPAQRNKIALQPPILPSSASLPQTVPAAALHTPIPAGVHHIKWHDSEKLPPPSGHKCMLCKRDLTFTAEGQVYQPAIPPPVAVLPCGHTFHDHCLQLITPQNQSKDPPCIPCAIGET